MEEKVYSLRISEKELKDVKVKDALVRLIENRIRLQKNKTYLKISSVEHIILKKHYSWRDVSAYAPKKKDQLSNELGKVKGKRCVLRGSR